jgi:hypothetical protein
LASALTDTHSMGDNNVALLSARFAEKHREAHAYLRDEMNKLGLLEADGWQIAEIVRECRGRTELVLRPMHLHLDAPKGLECVVWFIEEATRIGAECAPNNEGSPSSSRG